MPNGRLACGAPPPKELSAAERRPFPTRPESGLRLRTARGTGAAAIGAQGAARAPAVWITLGREDNAHTTPLSISL